MNKVINYISYQSFPAETANSLQTISNLKYLKKNDYEVRLFFPLREKNSSDDLKTIQKTVWGHSNDLETHTVETHIYRLRKKMIKNFEDHNFIKHDQDGYFIN